MRKKKRQIRKWLEMVMNKKKYSMKMREYNLKKNTKRI